MLLPTSFEVGVWLHGPRPDTDTTGETVYALQPGIVRYGVVNDGMFAAVRGPFGPDEIVATADDLLRALLIVRNQLPAGWLVLVQGARRDAWHSTENYPCGPDQARLHPELDQPPADEPVSVVAPLAEDELALVATAREQFAYRQEWAGEGSLWSRLRSANDERPAPGARSGTYCSKDTNV